MAAVEARPGRRTVAEAVLILKARIKILVHIEVAIEAVLGAFVEDLCERIEIIVVVFAGLRLNGVPGDAAADYIEAAIPELLKKRLVPLAVIFSHARAADLAPLVTDVDAVEYALSAEFIDKAHTVGKDRVHFHFLRGLFIDALEFLRKRGCIG